jgi:hypothetical protein
MEPDVWSLVGEGLDPARTRPQLRAEIEEARLTSLRGARYVMLRSPDQDPSYLPLSEEELALAHRMDGHRTVAGLIADLARATGRVEPDHVRRLVADLGTNGMLTELPVAASGTVEEPRQAPLLRRVGGAFLGAVRGRRTVLGDVDFATDAIYRHGGRFLFTRTAAAIMTLVASVGLVVFVLSWAGGSRSAFLTRGSYLLGALTLLALNVVCLAGHELGHALAVKHSGRHTRTAGVLLYFGMPSVFVDTTDVCMAGRDARLITSAAGPAAALTMAGLLQLVAQVEPAVAGIAFKLAFVCYLNTLFSLCPLLALDGYHLMTDWLEIPHLRSRGIQSLLRAVERKGTRWKLLDREERLVAMYGLASLLWLVVAAGLLARLFRDRVSGLTAGLWFGGWPGRVLLVAFVAGLLSPLVYAMCGWLRRGAGRMGDLITERQPRSEEPRRLDVVRRSWLGRLERPVQERLARVAVWVHPQDGADVLTEGELADGVLVVDRGVLVARRHVDPPGWAHDRAPAGTLVGAATALSWRDNPATWTAFGVRALAIPRDTFADALRQSTAREPTRSDPLPSVRDALPGRYDETRAHRAHRAHRVPGAGVHGTGGFGYPPLMAPPGSPPPYDETADDTLDARFRWLLLALLLLGLLSISVNVPSATAWAETADDHAVLAAVDGPVNVLVDGRVRTIGTDQRVSVAVGDPIAVPAGAKGLLTFRGGARAVLCPGTRADLTRLAVVHGSPLSPRAGLRLSSGAVLADTTAQTSAFRPLSISAGLGEQQLRNVGEAEFWFSNNGAGVHRGSVYVGGRRLAVSALTPGCGAAAAATAGGSRLATGQHVGRATNLEQVGSSNAHRVEASVRSPRPALLSVTGVEGRQGRDRRHRPGESRPKSPGATASAHAPRSTTAHRSHGSPRPATPPATGGSSTSAPPPPRTPPPRTPPPPPPDSPPSAQISNPGDGASFPPGTVITLSGDGSDPEDGVLPDSAFRWSSSVDGSLGSGRAVQVTLSGPPSCGTTVHHTITLTVVDSDGEATTATVGVDIGQTC